MDTVIPSGTRCSGSGPLAWRRWLPWLAYALLFGLAFGQKALYVSNQNTKFLIGLARGGYGYLHNDWLAGATDPFPLFSKLVELTWRWGDPLLFHAYYILLVAAYALAGLLIASWWFGEDAPRGKLALFAGFLFLFHAHPVRRLFHEYFPAGLGRQYLLGCYLEPATFGAFLLLGVGLFMHRWRYPGMLLLALAACMHPTYIIGASVLALSCFAWMLTDPSVSRKQACLALGIFLLALSPMLLYTRTALAPTSPEIQATAASILANERIPTHAKPDHWRAADTLPLSLMMIFGIAVAHRRRLVLLMLPLALLIVGSLLWVAAFPSDRLSLIAPWRVSSILVPLAVFVLLAQACHHLYRWAKPLWRARPAHLLAAGAAVYLTAVGFYTLPKDYARQRRKDTAALFAHIGAHKSPRDIFLTPVEMRDFRLATGAPAMVTWKSHPTRDIEFLAWYHRLRQADAFFKAPPTRRQRLLAELVRECDLTHVVLENGAESAGPALGAVVYRDARYTVLRIDPAALRGPKLQAATRTDTPAP